MIVDIKIFNVIMLDMKSAQAHRPPGPRKTRGYRQDVRAEQARANERAVLDAAVGRLRNARRVADVTLEDVAREAGVTVRTILRQYGSKDGIMEAAFLEVGRQIEAARPASEPGDVEGALSAMLVQYEAEGDLNARVVAEEHEIPILHRLLELARKSHRKWLAHAFGPLVAHLPPAEREQRITALYAATEVQLWKVLRRDLHQSAGQTAVIFRQLVRGVLSA
jgi:AcrR family transcriptional regulator